MKRESRPYVTTANVAMFGNVNSAVKNASRITGNALIQIVTRWGIFRRNRMSRESETLNTIGETMEMMIGDVQKPSLYLLPILSQIALSLAVIADCMREEQHG